MTHNKSLPLIFLLFSLLAPGVSHGQDDLVDEEFEALLEEVIVTSRKRLEMMSDTPISLHVVTGDDIQEKNILNMQELVASIPNVDIKESSIGDYLFVRGVGSGINAGFEQTVGTYVDGIYFGRSHLSRAPLFDIERVEVLRGPQGILFGKNTVAGAINITTVDPQALAGGMVGAYYNDRGEYTADATANWVLTDTLFGRLSVRQSNGDGHTDNRLKDRDEPDRDITSGRIGFSWDASDDVQVIAKYGKDDLDITGFSNEVIKCSDAFSATVSLDDDCRGNWKNFNGGIVTESSDGTSRIDFSIEGITSDIESGSLLVTWNYNDYTVTSITGYAAYDLEEFTDGDFSPTSLLSVERIEDFSQLSQELRIVSPLEEQIEWLAGIYWQTSELEAGGAVHLNPAPGSVPASDRNTRFEQDADSVAVFGQLSYFLSDQWIASLGLRFAKESKDVLQSTTLSELNQSAPTDDFIINNIVWATPDLNSRTYDPITDSRDESNFTPSFNLQYEPDNDTMLYFTASKGFKGGGFDFLLGNDEDVSNFEYEEEEVIAFEVGSKLKLAGGRGELNIALFHSTFDDVQVSVFNGALDLTVTNAGETRAQGIEVDGRWKFDDNWMLGFAGAFLDAEYKKFPVAQCYNGQTVEQGCRETDNLQDLAGASTLFSPDYTLNLNLNYWIVVADVYDVGVQLNANFMDDYHFDADNDPFLVQDSYVMWDLNISLAYKEQWNVGLVGKNITDELVYSFGTDVPLNPGSYYAQPGNRRTLGLQFSWNF